MTRRKQMVRYLQTRKTTHGDGETKKEGGGRYKEAEKHNAGAVQKKPKRTTNATTVSFIKNNEIS